MLKQFITYFFRAKRGKIDHPIVQEFKENVLEKIKDSDLSQLENYKRKLLQNKEEISIVDYGAGSRKKQNDTRSIASIAKTSGTPIKYAKVLAGIVKHYKPKHSLELGTSLGLGSIALSQFGQLTTIEGETSVFNFNLENHPIQTIDFRNQLFDEFLDQNQTNFDVIFIDGNHSYEATLKYFNILLKQSTENAIFIFDDINWSKGMQDAWNEISNGDSHTAIDLFKFGILFKEKPQNGPVISVYY